MSGQNSKGEGNDGKKLEENKKFGNKNESVSFDPIKTREKSLRFQLPEPASEESFSSALSFASEEVNEEYTAGIPSQEAVEVSLLKKFILSPLPHSQPKTATVKQCFSTDSSLVYHEKELQTNICLSSASSSRQLFEILKNSPTPSDADLDLIKSTFTRKLEGMKEAIDNGANVNAFRDRQTPLMIATELGDVRLVRYLLTVPKIDMNFRNVFGETPLLVAIRNTFDEILRLLLSSKASVNLADNMGKTPLHEAVYLQRPRIAQLLITYGANFNKADCFGERPIFTAVVKKPSMECLMVLLGAGASTEYQQDSGSSLLSRSILHRTDLSVIELLVKNGASVNKKDLSSGKTPLHYAAMIDDVNIAKFLVKRGANVNVKTIYNFTPFDEAVFHKSLSVAKYLVDLTKNPNYKNFQKLKNEYESKHDHEPAKRWSSLNFDKKTKFSKMSE